MTGWGVMLRSISEKIAENDKPIFPKVIFFCPPALGRAWQPQEPGGRIGAESRKRAILARFGQKAGRKFDSNAVCSESEAICSDSRAFCVDSEAVVFGSRAAGIDAEPRGSEPGHRRFRLRGRSIRLKRPLFRLKRGLFRLKRAVSRVVKGGIRLSFCLSQAKPGENEAESI